MEKSSDSGNFHRGKLRKVWLFMKCFMLFMFFAFSGIAATYSQEKAITLSVERTALTDVFARIRAASGYTFIYNADDLRGLTVEALKVKDAPVEEVLARCLEGTGFTFRIEDNVVVIAAGTKAAQEAGTVVIRGKVVDTRKQPVPGVTIIIQGTTLGTTTGEDGTFALEIPEREGITLLFSFIGMKTVSVAYTGQENLQITMEEEATEISEVVVTGYQTIDRRKNTSAVTSVKAEDIMIPGAMTIDQMLEGQIPDLMVMTNSGESGVAPRIRIRGTSTLIGNREPLWVVDGVIVQDPVQISPDELNDPDYINRIGNAISGLNPQDIDRIDVLKDASATALYGTKAANGVIVITTKRGHIGEPEISYRGTVSLKLRPRYSDRNIDLMSAKERLNVSRELAEGHYEYASNITYTGYEELLQKLYSRDITYKQFEEQVSYLKETNTDWFKLLTQDAFSSTHSLSVTGGSEDVRYYASLGVNLENDVIRSNDAKRYTGTVNLDINFTPWFTASFNLNANTFKKDMYQSEISPINYAYNTSRAIAAYTQNGEYNFYNKVNGSEAYKYNILNELENSYQDQHTSGLTVTANLRFNFTPWLNANAILSYTNSNAEIEGYWGEKTFHAAELRGAEYGEAVPSNSLMPYGGELSHNETRSNTYTFRFQANANKYFGTHEQHNINASAGFEMNSTKYVGYTRSDRGYYPDRGKQFMANINIEEYPDYGDWLSRNVPVLSDELTNILSGYATVAYSYRNLFTVSANARVDGSNRFGDQSNDKFLPIWSLSANYNIADHEFFKRDWLNYFTFKFSFGYQGNMLDSESPVLLINKLPMDSYYNEMEAEVSTYPNPNLKWEKTSSLNAGLTFALLDNRIQMETEYYYKHTKNAFMTKKVATMNGVNSYTINGGDIENQGYSVSLTAIPIRNNDWNWVLSTSFSRDYNKVNSDPSSQTYEYTEFLNGTALVEGKAVNTFYSYEFLGLNPVDGGPMFNDYEDQKYELYGLDKYHTITKVLKPSGRREPYMSGSLTTSLRYKNWRLNAAFPYSLGAKTRLFRMFDKSLSPENNVHRDFLNRWKEPGDEKHTNIPALLSYSSNSYWNYMGHYSAGMFEDIETFATSAWEMYDYSDIRVVSANYLKCSSLSLTYEFDQKLLERTSLSRVAITLSGTNLFTICSSKLNGQTPTQGGFSEIQLSDRPTYSLGLSVSF